MTKYQKTLIAAAIAMLSAGTVHAGPVFMSGVNDVAFDVYENQYRPDASCGSGGGCMGSGSGPSGWQLVDRTIAGNIAIGDSFAGVAEIYQILNEPSGTINHVADFSGYFAQTITGLNFVSGTTYQIDFGNPGAGADPFGLMGANESLLLYTGTSLSLAGTAAASLASATTGTFWGALGIGAVNPLNGYSYTLDNFALAGSTSFVDKYYSALDLVAIGPSYNAGNSGLVNDTSEAIVGGVTAGNVLLCAPGDIGSVACTDFAGNADIKNNPAFASGAQPWEYVTNDPLYEITTVPEPGTIALLGMGLLGLARMRRNAA